MARTRYVLIWLGWAEGVIERPMLGGVRRSIEDLIHEPRGQVEIDLWLESPGGDAHMAYKLALMLRDAAAHIRVVVPDYAKSAATLLTLVGDEIYMAPGAELGPLDAQLPEEEGSLGAISALNIAHAADAVAEDAVDLAGKGGARLLRQTGLSRAETLKLMLTFSAQFSEPLVRQLNPTLVHHAKELLRVTVRYAERLLEKTTGDDAGKIASELVENCPTHGFVIAYDDAQRLGLPVRHIEDYDLLALLRPLHRVTELQTEPVIELLPLADLEEKAQSDDQEEAQTTDQEADNSDEEQTDEPSEPRSVDGKTNGVTAGRGSKARRS